VTLQAIAREDILHEGDVALMAARG